MTVNAKCLLTAVVLSITLIAVPAVACDQAGPDTHVGKIKAIDLAQSSFTILDQQMRKPFTFLAAPEQLKGLSLGQVVMVKYSEARGQLKAEEINPL